VYTSRPAAFTYHRATSVDEAVRLLADLPDARLLAGGHSLLPAMKLRLSTPAALIDIARIAELDTIEENGDGIQIGALARHADVAASALVQRQCGALAEAAALIGDPQVRNRGTIGGSLAHADPGADYPAVVRALGATITAVGPGGSREIAANDFFVGLFTTALEPGELITGVRIPIAEPGAGSAYVKHPHPASGYSVAGAATLVSTEGERCTGARLVIGGVGATPIDASAATEALVGVEPSADAVAAAAERVPDLLGGAIGDTYASAGYRRHLGAVLAGRALTRAVERARSPRGA
jgi:carbon-monoxide dehydrogenase medium subunit